MNMHIHVKSRFFLLLLTFAAATAINPPSLRAQSTTSTLSQQGRTHWSPSIPSHQRTWLGPEFWANRLHDWQIKDGRIECIENSLERPMRTAHLLTQRTGNGSIHTVAGAVDKGELTSSSCVGFLIGAGSDAIDYRLSALVHHRPGEDGGLLAVVDGAGRVSFRDFSKGESRELTGPLADNEVPEMPATRRNSEETTGGLPDKFMLSLLIHREGAGYTLIMNATALEQPVRRISWARLENVDPNLVEGGIALVSHLGPQGSRNGFWFRDLHVSGMKTDHAHSYGPVLGTQYTLGKGILKLTAQMPPLGGQDTKEGRLEIRHVAGEWSEVARGKVDPDSFTLPFRVEKWDATKEAEFRVVYDLHESSGTRATEYRGTIRKEPADKSDFVVAAFTGNKNFTYGLKWNSNGIWFPHRDIISSVKHHKPDLLFFSGDQVYETDLTGAQKSPVDKQMLDYLDKWYRWCWAFGELTREIPAVTIPDDHEVYQGNLWGAGGRPAKTGDDGGYVWPARFVKMVERTNVSHLPDAFDPTPVEQGIGVYYTSLSYGGISFAVLEDRKWKSSATDVVPEGRVENGWFLNPDFDPRKSDVPGAHMHGPRQLEFLRKWSEDWSGGAKMKCVLSQTIYANVATIPPRAETDRVLPRQTPAPRGSQPRWKLAADTDSNSWPMTERNLALREMQRGLAFHIAGDQHLGSTIQYGIDGWKDAGFALCVPSVANAWPRCWYPPEDGQNRKPDAPWYSGDFLDGFGNHMTVHAVSNPTVTGHEPAVLHDRAPGYGIVKFDKADRKIEIQCWPRWADPSAPDAKQYEGWPITISQFDNDGRAAIAYLPELQIEGGSEEPVIQVSEEQSTAPLYTVRIKGKTFRPKVFAEGKYTVRVGDGETWLKTLNLESSSSRESSKTVKVSLQSKD